MLSRIKTLLTDNENKTLVKNISGAFIVKGLALLVSLFTMPAYMDFFDDQEMLGVWYTLLSVMTWILNLDLGIGNGLRNKLAMTIAVKDEVKTKEYISSAYLMIGMVSAGLALLMTVLVFVVNWNSFFNIFSTLIGPDDLRIAVLICVLGIVLQFFLRLVSSILYALQKSAINNLISLITSFSQLILVLVIPSSDAVTNLKVFSLLHGLCVNIPLLIATIVVFWKILPNSRPSATWYRKDKAKSVVSLGGVFFLCQVLYMVLANTNEFFISHFMGAEYVVDYQIYNRLFSLASMVTSLALSPVWSAVTRAKAQDNYIWLGKLYKSFKLVGLLGVFGEFILIPFLQFIINIWLGDNAIQVNYGTALVFAVFGATALYQSVVSTFVCGLGQMRLQAAFYSAGVVLKIVFIPIVAPIIPRWEVVIIANILVLLPYCIAQHIELNLMMKRNVRCDKKDELSVVSCDTN